MLPSISSVEGIKFLLQALDYTSGWMEYVLLSVFNGVKGSLTVLQSGCMVVKNYPNQGDNLHSKGCCKNNVSRNICEKISQIGYDRIRNHKQGLLEFLIQILVLLEYLPMGTYSSG